MISEEEKSTFHLISSILAVNRLGHFTRISSFNIPNKFLIDYRSLVGLNASKLLNLRVFSSKLVYVCVKYTAKQYVY